MTLSPRKRGWQAERSSAVRDVLPSPMAQRVEAEWMRAGGLLALIESAPVVPLSVQERKLLAEVDPSLAPVPHAEVARKIRARPDAE